MSGVSLSPLPIHQARIGHACTLRRAVKKWLRRRIGQLYLPKRHNSGPYRRCSFISTMLSQERRYSIAGKCLLPHHSTHAKKAIAAMSLIDCCHFSLRPHSAAKILASPSFGLWWEISQINRRILIAYGLVICRMISTLLYSIDFYSCIATTTLPGADIFVSDIIKHCASSNGLHEIAFLLFITGRNANIIRYCCREIKWYSAAIICISSIIDGIMRLLKIPEIGEYFFAPRDGAAFQSRLIDISLGFIDIVIMLLFTMTGLAWYAENAHKPSFTSALLYTTIWCGGW